MGKTITLDHVTKIEGHAKLNIKVREGKVEQCELSIIEGARYFEGILKGKKYNDVSHITSRICGVCSVSHTIASVKAVEAAFNIKVSEQTKKLRELLSIGGIIQSHILHLYFLALPDYYKTGGAMGLLKKHKELVERALRLKRLGNEMVITIAGRDVHPIACVIGGFSRIPTKEKMKKLLDDLYAIKDDAIETVKLFMGLDYPEFYETVPLFALTGGSYFDSEEIVRCEKGVCFPTKNYSDHFKEYFREGNTAEFATNEGKEYFTGSLPRIINNTELLSDESAVYVEDIEHKRNNPFMNVPAQAIEVLDGVNRAIEILQDLELKEEELPENNIKTCACEGIAAVSAPRGMLFHRFKFDEEGYCTEADITTPTTQNLALMEKAIRDFLPRILDQSEEEIKDKIEMLIRAYDPCISCSTHFLEMHMERS